MQFFVTEHERRVTPTYNAAARVVSANDPRDVLELLGWTLLRSLVIGGGMALGGVRGKPLFFGALAGSAMVSAFSLWRSYSTHRRDQKAQAPLGVALIPYTSWSSVGHRHAR